MNKLHPAVIELFFCFKLDTAILLSESSDINIMIRIKGLLEEKRQLEWKKVSDSSLHPLIFKGCEGHLTNLVSCEFEKRLITRCRN